MRHTETERNDLTLTRSDAYSVYAYRLHEEATSDGRKMPLYRLERVAGPFATTEQAYVARDDHKAIRFLDDYTVLPDGGEVYGWNTPCREGLARTL